MNKSLFSWIPNFLTLCNLLCGSIAILYAIEGNFFVVFWLTIAAAIFDFSDGFAARILNAYSNMGKELDSLADMVSFGLVPSISLFSLMQSIGAGHLSYVAFVIVLFSALRLAKFNVDTNQTDSFIGLPTPACAIFFASYVLIYPELQLPYIWINTTIIVTFATLLVAHIPMFSFKFKSLGLKHNTIRYLFTLFALGCILFFGYASPVIIILAYIATSLIELMVKKK